MRAMPLPTPGRTLALIVSLGCAGSAVALVVARDAAKAPAPGVVALVAGKAVTETELEELAKDRLATLRSSEYRIKRQVLEDHIARTLLEAEARSRGVSVEELEKSAESLGDDAETAALSRIEAGLSRRRGGEARRALVEGLKTRAGVQIFLSPPPGATAAAGSRVTLGAAGSFSKGPADAPVTLMEFSDFQCPACRRGVPTVRRIQELYGDKVRLVFRDFPLAMHRYAAKAAEAGRCAGEQGRFWPMHDQLFAGKAALDVSALKQQAAELGLDPRRFDECLDSGRFGAAVQRDVEAGRRAGVAGTPTFFVNGRISRGAQLSALTALIDEELQATKAQAAPSLPNKTSAP
jgi:protein-disulfide isomerase